MPVIPFKSHTPYIPESCFVAPDAWVTGDVTLADEVSIFFGAVLRGDILPIRIGARTNLQEQVVVHTSGNAPPVEIDDEVTVGHRAIIHSARIERRCIVGMGAVVLDGAVVGEESMIGAQTVVPMNMQIPPRSLVVGVPGKIKRELRDEEIAHLAQSASHYATVGQEYRTHFRSMES